MKTLAADIHPYVYHPLLTFRSCFTAEEYQIARLQIGKVGRNVNMFTYVSLLGSVTRDNDVVHKKYSTHESAAIHPFDEVPAQR